MCFKFGSQCTFSVFKNIVTPILRIESGYMDMSAVLVDDSYLSLTYHGFPLFLEYSESLWQV